MHTHREGRDDPRTKGTSTIVSGQERKEKRKEKKEKKERKEEEQKSTRGCTAAWQVQNIETNRWERCGSSDFTKHRGAEGKEANGCLFERRSGPDLDQRRTCLLLPHPNRLWIPCTIWRAIVPLWIEPTSSRHRTELAYTPLVLLSCSYYTVDAGFRTTKESWLAR